MENFTEKASQTLDVQGLNCPLPILRAKKALAVMQAGEVLEVLATDRAAPSDFEAFCRQTGHVLLASETLDGDIFRLLVQRKA